MPARVRALRDQILTRARALERTANRLSRGGELTPETLHRFHQNLRHLRVEYRVWHREASREATGPSPGIDARLRRLLTLAGEVRDRDVGLAWLHSLGPSPGEGAAGRALERIAKEIAAERRLGTELLRAQARIELGTRLVPELEAEVGGQNVRMMRRVHRGLAREGARHGRRVRATLRAARKRPTVRRLHRFRRAVRDARTFGDLRQALGASGGVRWATPVRRLHAQLGDLHDVNILFDRLSRRPGERAVGALLEALDRERREIHGRILRRLDAAKRRRWLTYLDLP